MSTPSPGPKPRSAFSGHLPALDGVRGLAILAVLFLHFVANTRATNPLERAVNWVLGYGMLGVDLFFILSGFLITGILYDSRDSARYFQNFYMRRVLRIFPLYYFVLFVVFVVLPLVPALEGSEILRLREHQAWAWLYGVNIFLAIEGGWTLSYIQHFWTLAVEEHFYFVWPLGVWLLAARPRALMGTALALAGLSLGGRVALSVAGANPMIATVLTPFQLDALCLGAFFAVFVRQPGGEAAVRRLIAPMAAVAGGFALATFGLHRLTDFGIEVIRPLRGGMFRVVLAALLLWALTAPLSSLVSRFFRSGPMVALGKYSYGLYVYHHFLSYYLATHGTEFALARAVGSHTLAVAIQATAGITISSLAAWLSYEYLEKPFLQLKRFWPSGQAPRSRPDGGRVERAPGGVPTPVPVLESARDRGHP